MLHIVCASRPAPQRHKRHKDRKLETNIPRNETAGLQSQFLHSCLYIPLIRLSILPHENRWAERGNILIALRHMNVEIGTEAAQFLFWEYINPNFFAVWSPLRITAVLATHLRAQPMHAFLSKRLTRLRCSYRFCTIVSVNPKKILGENVGKKSESPQDCSPEIRSFQSFRALVTSRKPCIRKLNNLTVPSFFVFVAFPNMLFQLFVMVIRNFGAKASYSNNNMFRALQLMYTLYFFLI
jgi:hypothetical protein